MSAALEDAVPSRKEGWIMLAEAGPRPRPRLRSREEIALLSPQEKAAYDLERRVFHANLGPLRTPQMAAIHEDLWDIVDSNLQDGDKVKGAAAIDAYPGLGKTTTALAFARDLHRREIELHGKYTEDGHEHLPVCRIGLGANTTIKALNQAILEFFGHPGAAGRYSSTTTGQLAAQALDCILSCRTRLLVVDDVHFLDVRSRDGLEVSNHLKWLANEFPVTFLFVGVGLRDRGLMSEGMTTKDQAIAQTARRWTRLTLTPFTLSGDAERENWRNLLLAIEQNLVLADLRPGILADELSSYLFARTTGHIGSLMTLINRGAQRAVRRGEENLSKALLDSVKIDDAAEQARQPLQAALDSGRLTPRPRTLRKAPVSRQEAK
ncbi:AAA family ATPase [Streptomyces sp. NPDC101062]|uniref:AAA family ATPase n=1 Tax=unclassified Streptomyces TaxID=2593676 RepID=UPI003812608A